MRRDCRRPTEVLPLFEGHEHWIDERDIRLWAVIPLVMAVAILNQLYGWRS